MKSFIFWAAIIVFCIYSCDYVKEMVFGLKIISEDVTNDNRVMCCNVKDLLIREHPWASKDRGMADLDKGCTVEYLGEKSNEEARKYKKGSVSAFWYKIRFKVRNGRYKGQIWIGWVHGGGMDFVPQQTEPVATTSPQSSNPTSGLRKWAVIVGVSNYAVSANNLNYCDDDASAYYNFLRSDEGGAVPENHIMLLNNEAATADNIIAACNAIFAQASAGDIVIFYFSGHGAENYFCAHDRAFLHNDIKVILQNSPAKRKMMIGDACFSGSMIAQPATSEDTYAQYYNKEQDGIAFIAASQRDKVSVEMHQLGHGLFTYHFLNGLRNCAANDDNNAYVDISELRDYIKVQFKNSDKQTPKFGGAYDTEMPVSSCGN